MQRDLRYGTAPRALIDYFPAPAPARPAAGLLVYFHGGYWQELSKEESAFLAPAWHAAGLAHAVVGYTLAPAARCRRSSPSAARRWRGCRRTAETLGFDADDIVVAGSSAGGYLAAACAEAVATACPRHRRRVRASSTCAAHRHVDQRRARAGRGDGGDAGSAERRTRPIPPGGRRVGRDRDRGVQAPEPGLRRAARRRRRAVHVARSPGSQSLRRSSTWTTPHRHSFPPLARSSRQARARLAD